jgi:sRNA-binding carbon storage regulator CsrA
MYKLIKIITLSLIFCIVFITGCSKSISTTINELKSENIESARIELAGSILPGASPIKTYNFDFNNSKQTKIIEDVIKYLNSAKVQGNADEIVTNKGGGSPTLLILVNKDGSTIQIGAAVKSKITKLSNTLTERTGVDIPNEVTINVDYGKAINILSPEIRKLIDSGYKNIFE